MLLGHAGPRDLATAVRQCTHAIAIVAHEGLLCERLGAVRFGFHLYRKDAALHWAVHRVHLLGVIPLPASWFDAVRSRESVVDGRYHFEVQASLPLAGMLVRYEGHLEPVD